MIDFNGTFIDENKATLNLENRGYNYGDALFETLRVINGEIMFWEDHYFRLMASMRILRMEIPINFSPEYLQERITDLIEKKGLSDSAARVKINVNRQSGGLYKPSRRSVDYTIQAHALTHSFYTIDDQAPYVVELFKDHYVQSGLLSTVKSNNRLINVLGSIYAEENGYQNCLLLNEKKTVVEALNGNLFWVKGKKIKTSALKEGCLNGITRKKLIEVIEKTDFELEIGKISPFELQKADELFLTNVIVGIQPISQYRKKTYQADVAKVLLAKLNTLARLEKSAVPQH